MSVNPILAQPGCALPEVIFGPVTRKVLALYAGASGDHNDVHIDTDYASRAGLPDIFAHGMLSMAPLSRVVTDWAGLARVESLQTRFLAITPVNATVRCSGVVTDRSVEADRIVLRIALRAEIDGGTQTLAGEAVIRLARQVA